MGSPLKGHELANTPTSKSTSGKVNHYEMITLNNKAKEQDVEDLCVLHIIGTARYTDYLSKLYIL